jgi:predicted nucleic acid-binding protein
MKSTMRSTAADRLFIDSWGWLVFANDRDPSFGNVSGLRAVATARPSAWITTDYVLDETLTRIFMTNPFATARRYTEGIFEASRQGLLDIEHVTPERFSQAWRLRLSSRDKSRVSFTDLTSIVVMQELGLRHVVTGDAHFSQVGMGFIQLP